jgi:hypothetical protein
MTLVCHKNKIAFYHNPKTGGTSIKGYLKKYGQNIDLEDVEVWDDHEMPLQIINFCNTHLDRRDIKNYFSWSIVRNPYDRLVSLYHARKQDETPCNTYEQNFESWCHIYFQKYEPEMPQYYFYLYVDKVFKFENFDNIKEFIDKKYNIKTHAGIKKRNASNHKPWQEYYSKELCDLVYNYFIADFKFLDYKKLYK